MAVALTTVVFFTWQSLVRVAARTYTIRHGRTGQYRRRFFDASVMIRQRATPVKCRYRALWVPPTAAGSGMQAGTQLARDIGTRSGHHTRETTGYQRMPVSATGYHDVSAESQVKSAQCR
jgi:hypothetical protein